VRSILLTHNLLTFDSREALGKSYRSQDGGDSLEVHLVRPQAGIIEID